MSSACVDAADSPPASGSHAGQFKKGNPGYGLRKACGAREVVRVPALLKAMREVMARPESKDRTQLQRECRSWLKENRSQFMAKMADLERAHLMALAKEKPADPGDSPTAANRDEGSERIEEQIENLLAKLKEP